MLIFLMNKNENKFDIIKLIFLKICKVKLLKKKDTSVFLIQEVWIL